MKETPLNQFRELKIFRLFPARYPVPALPEPEYKFLFPVPLTPYPPYISRQHKTLKDAIRPQQTPAKAIQYQHKPPHILEQPFLGVRESLLMSFGILWS